MGCVKKRCGYVIAVSTFVILDRFKKLNCLFSSVGSIDRQSCEAEVTQWVLTEEQVGKVRSPSINCYFIIYTEDAEIMLHLEVVNTGVCL